MYLDSRGLVTTGVGNLLQSAKEASQYGWEDGSGNAVDAPTVEAEYRRIASEAPSGKFLSGKSWAAATSSRRPRSLASSP
jgi:hypothetical protein